MSTTARNTILTDKSRDFLVNRIRDTLAWPSWSVMDRAEIERPGSNGPSSPGEIRRFFVGKTIGREEVLESEGDVVLRYRLLEGLPMKNYVGEVAILDEAGKRRVIWSSSFDVPFGFGWIASMQMSRFFGKLLARLVAD